MPAWPPTEPWSSRPTGRRASSPTGRTSVTSARWTGRLLTGSASQCRSLTPGAWSSSPPRSSRPSGPAQFPRRFTQDRIYWVGWCCSGKFITCWYVDMATWRKAFDHEGFHSQSLLGSAPRPSVKGTRVLWAPRTVSLLTVGVRKRLVAKWRTDGRSWLKKIGTPVRKPGQRPGARHGAWRIRSPSGALRGPRTIPDMAGSGHGGWFRCAVRCPGWRRCGGKGDTGGEDVAGRCALGQAPASSWKLRGRRSQNALSLWAQVLCRRTLE